MSDFKVEVIRVGYVYKHPNANSLSITNIGAYQVIFRTGDFKTGDLAVYVPEESLVPLDNPKFSFLTKSRIRAKKLRGVFSCGLIVTADPGMIEGQEVSEQLGIRKYLTEQEKLELGIQSGSQGQNRTKSPKIVPAYLPRYTDIPNLRRYPEMFSAGEQVIVTEKIEGMSCAMAYDEQSLWSRVKRLLGFSVDSPVTVRSRNELKTEGKWFEIVYNYRLEAKFLQLSDPESYSIYGESYGHFKGFDYNCKGLDKFIVFDIWDRIDSRWLNWHETETICDIMVLPLVKVLYRGEYDYQIIARLAEENSSYGNHMREGVIVRSENESTVPGHGRKIAKYKSERYLTRND